MADRQMLPVQTISTRRRRPISLSFDIRRLDPLPLAPSQGLGACARQSFGVRRRRSRSMGCPEHCRLAAVRPLAGLASSRRHAAAGLLWSGFLACQLAHCTPRVDSCQCGLLVSQQLWIWTRWQQESLSLHFAIEDWRALLTPEATGCAIRPLSRRRAMAKPTNGFPAR